MSEQSIDHKDQTLFGLIQSFEKKAVLKPVAPADGAISAGSSVENNPKRLAVAALPALLLVLWAVGACVGRTVLNNTQQKVGGSAAANARVAKATVGSFLSYITDHRVSPDTLQFSELSAFSPYRNRYVGDWNVVYGTAADQQYLIRLNAATHKIYAINRTSGTLAASRPAEGVVTQEAAQMIALRYLGRLGNDIDALRLEPTNRLSRSYDTPAYSDKESSDSYVFFYRRHTASGQERLLLVAIDRATGGLNYYWNPSAAI